MDKTSQLMIENHKAVELQEENKKLIQKIQRQKVDYPNRAK